MDALIIADDLSGAADCAAASGAEATVMLSGPVEAGARVVAIDIDSRDLTPEAAAARARTAFGELPSGNAMVYQKLDSTLRGNWAFELDALISELASHRGRTPLAVLCPAFPERGRTLVNGTVLVDGQPVLAETIAARLVEAGRRASSIARGLGRDGLQQALAAVEERGDVAVCDARSREDLDVVAAASLNCPNVLWAGSAGLMGSLASQLNWKAPRAAVAAHPGCVLVVVGSASPVSRRQVERLAAQPGVESIVCPADLLVRRDTAALDRLTANVVAAARRSGCLAVSVGATAVPVDGTALVAGLAKLLVPLLPHFGGLVLTGGETARALLSGAGVRALDILGEVEPGVPFGRTVGALARPVVTKAGGFGTPDILIHATRMLTGAPRQQREPA